MRGNASGATLVNFATLIDPSPATRQALIDVANRVAGSRVTRNVLGAESVDDVLPDTGVSIIQVAGSSTPTTFLLEHGYVTGGTPYQYRLYPFGPGSQNGAAAPSQSLVGNPAGLGLPAHAADWEQHSGAATAATTARPPSAPTGTASPGSRA
ncbi:hypothetical protein [Variovorax sp. J22R115]|uniref:hypothetical protein n=1 Tax=Variovorax sp. J22R115 TaxID=3053509 RepID=UPI0025787D1F|nr:hypothetical protein [Variovorax sp. J22R115]MDM0052851.1 hypothetical protein [Variovorax sp. J22R115]